MEWIAIYRTARESDCREHALVLQAVGIACELRLEANAFVLMVEAVDAGRALRELDAYASENREGFPAGVALEKHADGWVGVYGYVCVLLLVGVMAQHRSFGADWLTLGRASARLIQDGEWWRSVTALTLHADLVHILANIVIGGWIGLYAGQSLGVGLAWFQILVAGAMGNYINAWIRPPNHASIGASTAVFAALGLLAAGSCRRRKGIRVSKLERWVPLVGGVLLLSFLGTGRERTDVGAHVLGFLSGVLMATLGGGWTERILSSRGAQNFSGTAALLLVSLAWMLALSIGRTETRGAALLPAAAFGCG